MYTSDKYPSRKKKVQKENKFKSPLSVHLSDESICYSRLSCVRDFGMIIFFKLAPFSLLYRVLFLFLVLFNLTSRSYFRSDFVDRPINLFTLLCAIQWGINHYSIITLYRVTSEYVKAVFFVKIDFSKIELKLLIFKIFL